MKGAADNQNRHRGGHAAHDRTHDKQTDGKHEQALAANHVAHLAENRKGDRLAQKEGGDHPGHVLDAAEVADDGGQGGGEDHLPQ